MPWVKYRIRRNSITGKIVNENYVKKHPHITETEVRKRFIKPKKKSGK
jgi:hypothetical protein